MDALLIEIRCNLSADDHHWKNIRSISLEIGYPGLRGQTLWKQTGWLQGRVLSAGSSSAHALWNRQTTGQTVVFDFHPLMLPENTEPEKSYCFRRSVMYEDGRLRTSKPIVVEEGVYTDQFFSCIPQYPKV
jgi:hypothetical protein